MKCFWQSALAVTVLALVAGTANAQLNPPGEIGSYQTILSQAGFSNQNQDLTTLPGRTINDQGPGMASNGAPAGNQQPAASGDHGVYQSAVAGCGTGCDTGNPFSLDGCGADCDTGRCRPRFRPLGPNVNRVVTLFGVSFDRSYEGNMRLGYNGAGTEYYSGDLQHDSLDGMGVTLASRGCCGAGWEATYWKFDECYDYSMPGPTYTRLYGMNSINHVPSGYTMYDIYNAGDNASFCRNTQVDNIEFNLLRNGGQFTTWGCWKGTYELVAGIRIFNFDEDLSYISNSTAGGYPSQVGYNLSTENTLVGFQAGGRNEICLTQRLRLTSGTTVGIFNNHVQYRQQMYDQTGYNPVIGSGPYAGMPFDYWGEQDETSLLAQLDVGLAYQLTCRLRARVGYRALGVTGVALALNQVPYDYADGYMMQSVNTGCSLFLQGLYYGGEFCF